MNSRLCCHLPSPREGRKPTQTGSLSNQDTISKSEQKEKKKKSERTALPVCRSAPLRFLSHRRWFSWFIAGAAFGLAPFLNILGMGGRDPLPPSHLLTYTPRVLLPRLRIAPALLVGSLLSHDLLHCCI